MGFFDSFKNRNNLSDDSSSGSQCPAALTWSKQGDFEITSCPGKDGLRVLEKLRQEGKANGFTAILLGDENDANTLEEDKEFGKGSTSERLQRMAAVDTGAWLNKRMADYMEHVEEIMGEWPEEMPREGNISAHLNILTGKPKPVVYLAKIATANNWEAPVYVGMGGWNECPDSEVLSAFAKKWHEQYGAEVASITRDVMEFIVARPPATREAAMELAKEQYIFCADIVDQGVGDISALAATLFKAKYWYFWWD